MTLADHRHDPDEDVRLSSVNLQDPSPAVRAAAVRSVAVIEDDLVGFLRDPAAEVRYAAASRLLREPVGAEQFLAAARVETDQRTRWMLLIALENRLQEPGVVRAVAGLLTDPVLGPRAAQALDRLLPSGPGVDALAVDGVLLEPGVAVPWEGSPAYVVRQSTCPACGVRQRLAGPLEWERRDEARSADVFIASVGGVVRISLTRGRLTWDA